MRSTRPLKSIARSATSPSSPSRAASSRWRAGPGVVEEVLEQRELDRAAERDRVRLAGAHELARHLADRDGAAAHWVDELRVDPVARREEAVLVEDSGACTPVRSSTALQWVSELTWSRVASGQAASTSSIAGDSAQPRLGSSSMTSPRRRGRTPSRARGATSTTAPQRTAEPAQAAQAARAAPAP
jgi:hypothetical protein